ncbi:MAG: phage tail tape measure protein [Paracoccaceae bacterium]|nr:phage tail tape measure protein [Paracoccaceae bacterium]
MDETDEIDGFDDQIAVLETTLGSAGEMAAAFDAELRRMQSAVTETGADVDLLARSLSTGLRKAFDGLIFDGNSLTDALRDLGQSMVDAAYAAAITPVTDQLGGLVADGVGGLFSGLDLFAKGGAFTQGRVVPFANGGIVSGPTAFPMRGGTGLMGEAGPEAIMPLTRGADGRLGVRAEGGGRPVNVVMNVSTPDVEGFKRSENQLAAQLSRALSRSERNQ